MFTFGGGARVWRSVKKSYIVDSTMEAECVAAYKVAKEAVWLCMFLIDLEVGLDMDKLLTLYCDNSGVVANSKKTKKPQERKAHRAKVLLDNRNSASRRCNSVEDSVRKQPD